MASAPVRGCRDLYGRLAAHRRDILTRFADHCDRYAFQQIEMPILEHAKLFGVLGRTSDIVASEMFFAANCDPAVALRPEGTAGAMRVLANAGLLKRERPNGTKIWYTGPMFRRERPQFKRWRQFMQMGVEWVGYDHVYADAEVIELAHGFLKEIDVDVKLRVNTLGSLQDRDEFNAALMEFLREQYGLLSGMSKKRFDSGNCMRILDSKLEEDREALKGAPSLAEFVGREERTRFEELKELLSEAEITFTVDDKLVRGLDYYTSTAFEFDGLEGKAVCAGGRYTNVVGASGVGFAIGLDRVEGEMEEDIPAEAEDGVVVIAHAKDATQSNSEIGRLCRSLVRQLRQGGVKAIAWLGGMKLSKAVPRAVRDGARAVIVVGEQDVEQGRAQVKFVTDNTDSMHKPEAIDVTKLVKVVQQRLGQR